MLSADEKAEILSFIEAGRSLLDRWRVKLFPAAGRTVEIGKENLPEYVEKMKREQQLADTPATPWQLVRCFNKDRSDLEGWRNLLVWGISITLSGDLNRSRNYSREARRHKHR